MGLLHLRETYTCQAVGITARCYPWACLGIRVAPLHQRMDRLLAIFILVDTSPLLTTGDCLIPWSTQEAGNIRVAIARLLLHRYYEAVRLSVGLIVGTGVGN